MPEPEARKRQGESVRTLKLCGRGRFEPHPAQVIFFSHGAEVCNRPFRVRCFEVVGSLCQSSTRSQAGGAGGLDLRIVKEAVEVQISTRMRPACRAASIAQSNHRPGSITAASPPGPVNHKERRRPHPQTINPTCRLKTHLGFLVDLRFPTPVLTSRAHPPSTGHRRSYAPIAPASRASLALPSHDRQDRRSSRGTCSKRNDPVWRKGRICDGCKPRKARTSYPLGEPQRTPGRGNYRKLRRRRSCSPGRHLRLAPGSRSYSRHRWLSRIPRPGPRSAAKILGDSVSWLFGLSLNTQTPGS